MLYFRTSGLFIGLWIGVKHTEFEVRLVCSNENYSKSCFIYTSRTGLSVVPAGGTMF